VPDRVGVSALALLAALALTPASMAAVAATSYTDDFTKLNSTDWDIYYSVGHDGNGLRRPSQVKVSGGVLTITGTANGTTGGMKWRGRSQQYGQWDIRMRARVGCICYHPVVLLWGTGGGSDVNNPRGEIDIVEVWQRPNRDRNSVSVHYGKGNDFVGTDVAVDMTEWHVYHLVWASTYLYTWIDDDPAYFVADEPAVLPPGPMDLAIQLDWFPQEGSRGGSNASMEVDYVRQLVKPA
jgi:hypothetical protein